MPPAAMPRPGAPRMTWQPSEMAVSRVGWSRFALRRFCILLAVLVFSAGLLPVAPARAEASLEDSFRGEAIGRGRFKSGLIGLDRGFAIKTIGRKAGDIFVLDQLFRFDDGQVDRRTWSFKRIGPNSYVGARRDLVGLAKVRIEDGVIRMSYDIEMRRRNGSKYRLHFEDSVSRPDRMTVLNRATIYTLGIPVGSVETTLTRR